MYCTTKIAFRIKLSLNLSFHGNYFCGANNAYEDNEPIKISL